MIIVFNTRRVRLIGNKIWNSSSIRTRPRLGSWSNFNNIKSIETSTLTDTHSIEANKKFTRIYIGVDKNDSNFGKGGMEDDDEDWTLMNTIIKIGMLTRKDF